MVSFQLAKIDRYQDRLSVMAYIGQFDELVVSVKPVCDHVMHSESCDHLYYPIAN